jgi:hypothetical protein
MSTANPRRAGLSDPALAKPRPWNLGNIDDPIS